VSVANLDYFYIYVSLCQNSKLVQETIAKYIYHAHKLRNLTNL